MNKIILIGGTPRCGKTTLAQKISKSFGIPWISTDTLEAIAHKYTPEDQQPTLFPKSILRRKTGGSNDNMYDTYTTEEILESYYKQADTTGEAIKTLVEYAIKEKWGYVIEGYHVTPKLIRQIKDKGLDITSIILVNTNSNEVVERSIASKVESDWVRDNTENKGTYTKIGTMIDLYSQKLIKEAEKVNVKVVDMGNDFQDRFNEVFEYLSKPNN